MGLTTPVRHSRESINPGLSRHFWAAVSGRQYLD
jgi:hypothetical protein